MLKPIAPLAALVVLVFTGLMATAACGQGFPTSRAVIAAGDFALDGRANIPNTGKTAFELYRSYFDVHAGGSDALATQLNLYGVDQHQAFRWQIASVSKELDNGSDHRLPDRIEAGIVRLPFGIYDYRETYASGLIDYPLARVDYAYNAVDWSVPGARWSGGAPNFQGEAAAFSGQGGGVWSNLNHIEGAAGRAQFYLPPNLIVGISGWQGRLAPFTGQPAETSRPVHLGGLDLRFTRSHLLLRGEFIGGALATSRRERGGYLDAYYRLPGIEKVTLLGRVEALKPDDNVPESRQLTLGARWNATPDWTVSANWRRNNLRNAYEFTWTPPAEGRGDVLVQVLRTFAFSTARP